MSFFLDSFSWLEGRDANAVAAAVLADLPAGKGLEEEIEGELGSGASKVWKEVKLLLQPQGKCENKEHAGKVEGEEEFVCEEADCLLLWLEDKTFSVSARTALMAWALLLARSKQNPFSYFLCQHCKSRSLAASTRISD